MKTIVLHIKVTMRSLPWFAALPTFSEYAVERGWTKCFSRISEVGWFAYLVYIMAYIAVVEFLTYWAHRKLHDIKPLYKYLHAQHHSYNKQHKISPFAGKFLPTSSGCLLIIISLSQANATASDYRWAGQWWLLDSSVDFDNIHNKILLATFACWRSS